MDSYEDLRSTAEIIQRKQRVRKYDEHISELCLLVATTLEKNPDKIIKGSMSLNINDESSDVFSEETTKRSVDGWILYLAYPLAKSKAAAYTLLEELNELALKTKRNSIITMGETNPRLVIDTLRQIAAKIS